MEESEQTRILDRIPIAIILPGVLESFFDNSGFAAVFLWQILNITWTILHFNLIPYVLIKDGPCALSICLIKPQTLKHSRPSAITPGPSWQKGDYLVTAFRCLSPPPPFLPQLWPPPFFSASVGIPSRLLKAELLSFEEQLSESRKETPLGT